MKKFGMFVMAFMVSLPVWAEVNLEPLLNKVTLQLNTEQWLTTKTALVNVSVNASVTDQGIEKVQAEVINKLNQLSNKGEWHLLSFNRSQDQSGLESIQILAQARLAQTELSGMRDKAKSISIPGEKFTIDSVQFTPSEDEVRQANVVLRNNIYQQAKAEIDALNKQYPEQKYYLHNIDFVSQSPVEAVPMAANVMNMQKISTDRSIAPPLSIGNKLQLQAMVVVAAMPDVVAQKLAHN